MSDCADKYRYPDKGTAFFALRQRLHSPQKRIDFLRVYQCPHCRGWHLTHRARNHRRRRPHGRQNRKHRRRPHDLGLNFYDT